MLTSAERSAKYRAKDINAYRERKREYAKTPKQKIKRKLYMREWVAKNREKYNEMCNESHKRQRRKRTPLQRHNEHLKATYGITRDDFDVMLKSQNGICAICGSDTARWVKNFHVDHCHKTGKIRGLLCNRCNPMLGWYETYAKEIESYLVGGGGHRCGY